MKSRYPKGSGFFCFSSVFGVLIMLLWMEFYV